MVLLPLLALSEFAVSTSMGLAVLQAVGIMVLVVLAGRYAIGPALHPIARMGNSDTFVAMALLLVLGFACHESNWPVYGARRFYGRGAFS